MGRWLLIGGLALLGLGCGNSEKNQQAAAAGASGGAAGGSNASGGGAGGNSSASGSNSGGSATQAGSANASGNGTGGAGAGGAAIALGDSAAEACIAYVLAVCKRQSVCSGREAEGQSCLAVAASCPDLTLSPGSTRTAAGLKACAETYDTLPCDQVSSGVLPACVTPGTRAAGEACSYSSQCSSLECKYSSQACGKCAAIVADGQSCAADDQDCGPASYCGPGEVCAPIASSPSAMAPIAPGKPCTPTDSCAEGYYCYGSPTGVCTALPTVGQSCNTLGCGINAYCVRDAQNNAVCAASPGQGEPCARSLDSGVQEPFVCQKGLLCSYTTPMEGTCQPPPTAGQPCNIAPSNLNYGRCAADLQCIFASNPPLCRGPGKAGEACTSGNDCDPQLACDCPESAPGCTAKVCVKWKLGGEACGTGDTLSSCHPAFDCKAGKCAPAELRGVFAKSCGM